MKNLAIIPARSGSKGLKNKNILPLTGKPLLAHSIEAASSSGCFDTVHVSTDSEKYAGIARRYGADIPFLRSAETSSDSASSWAAMLEVLENYERLGKTFDTVALLQPTSPLRTADDIRRAYQMMEEKGAETVVSVCEAEHSPLWCGILPEDNCMDGFLPPEAEGQRQALRTYYRLNGALYLLKVPVLRRQGKVIYNSKCYAYVMPQKRSVDIDTSFDFLIAEQRLRPNNASSKQVVRADQCPHITDNLQKNAPPPRGLSVIIARFPENYILINRFFPFPARKAPLLCRKPYGTVFTGKERGYAKHCHGGGTWFHGQPQAAAFEKTPA